MKLTDLIAIDNRFEKSINLLLDLNNEKKVKDYVPTRSSIRLLKTYLSETVNYTGSRATALIGPYGKGKSHLLLVLLYLLSMGKTPVSKALVKRIAQIDPESEALLKSILNEKARFLPVILNVSSSANLEQAMIKSLFQVLHQEKLFDAMPDSYFSMAIKTIDQWKEQYPNTYEALCDSLVKHHEDIESLIVGLGMYDQEKLELFRKIYPSLTSGGVFNPIINEDAVAVYRSVNRRLHDRYGYKGIFIVFDEFSKYIEGHTEAGFAEDMKTLQDICELCNSSTAEQLHLVCVAHKTIKSYGNSLPSAILNTFKGVEGRLKEEYFVVSSKNSYELIADAIHKTPIFEAWSTHDEHYQAITKESGTLRCFASQFDEEDYTKLIAQGCFPLTPLAASLLLELSERVAQNERTIFTFITSKDRYSLNSHAKGSQDVDFVGTDLVYDYFENQFKDDVTSMVHNEWLKADYALSKTQSEIGKKIIKALAIIRMTNNYQVYACTRDYIRLAAGLPKDLFEKEFEALERQGAIEYKTRSDSYSFKNEVMTNIDTAIMDCIKRRYSNTDVAGCLNDIVSNRFIAPKKHNQDYCITRYFNYIFMSQLSFENLQSVEYLQWKNRPDGVIILIMPEEYEEKSIIEHLKKLNDPCVVVCLPKTRELITDRIQHLLAVRYLRNDSEFIDNNPVLRKELFNIEDDLIDEIDEWIETNYLRTEIVYTRNGAEMIGAMGINRIVSDICDTAYNKTPIINNEMINRHELSGQTLKARNMIIEGMLENRDFSEYEKATSAEATIYRATILQSGNEDIREIRDIITSFLIECTDKKTSFDGLLRKLTKPPFGMRLGVIPLFLMDIMLRMEDMPVLYVNDKEVPVDVNSINSITKRPEESYLLIEKATVEKTKYIEELARIFSEYLVYCGGVDPRNKLAKITCLIQSWYRSLPQTSVTFIKEDYQGQDMNVVSGFRKLFSEYSINPREILLDKLPSLLGTSIEETATKVLAIKKEIDEHIHLKKKNVEAVVRKQFNIPTGDDLCESLRSWLTSNEKTVKQNVLGYHTGNIVNFISNLNTHDEESIVSYIAYEITGSYIEDWKDNSIEEFVEGLDGFLNEIYQAQEEKKNDTDQKITFTTADGSTEQKYYRFDADSISPSGQFFKNALDEVMDEYGTMVDKNERLGILMSIINELVK